jgi:hypothetical protein
MKIRLWPPQGPDNRVLPEIEQALILCFDCGSWVLDTAHCSQCVFEEKLKRMRQIIEWQCHP